MRNAIFERAQAIAGLIGLISIIPVWIPGRSRTLESFGWKLLLWGFGVRVELFGDICRDRPVLYVSNHISWLDIAVLGSVIDASFIAKAEVERWPLIGYVARRAGSVFVARERRSRSAEHSGAIGERLKDGKALILFPEATTGPGHCVLPFRSSLFSAVTEMEGCAVQPVTITYQSDDGLPLAPGSLREIAWLDDDGLLTHAIALMKNKGITVRLDFASPLQDENRKSLAAKCHLTIAGKLAETYPAHR